MNTWKNVVHRRLGGDPATEVPPEMDFPPVTDTGAAAWRATLDRLSEAQARLQQALRGIRDGQLDEPPAQGVSTRYRLLHGVIQHDLYHAGQIAILKKG